jgi:hypothetical protein
MLEGLEVVQIVRAIRTEFEMDLGDLSIYVVQFVINVIR